MMEPRIDLLILPGGTHVLTSPQAPGAQWPVIPENGTDDSGIADATRQFRAHIAATALKKGE